MKKLANILALFGAMLIVVSGAMAATITLPPLRFYSCAQAQQWVNKPCGQEAQQECASPWYTVNWASLQPNGGVLGNSYLDDLPLDVVVTDVDVTFYLYQSRSNIKYNVAFNGKDLATASDPRVSQCLADGPYTQHCPVANNAMQEECIPIYFNGQANAEGFPGYKYGDWNNIEIRMAPNTKLPAGVFIQHVEVTITFIDRPGIKSIQADSGTQDLWDYHQQAKDHPEYAINENDKFFFLGDPDEVLGRSHVTYWGKFIEPLVVPYGQPFAIHVELFDDAEVPNETFKWEVKIGKVWTRTVSDVTERSFFIRDLLAPSGVGISTLRFTTWKQTIGKNGSPVFSNPKSVEVPFYSVFGFSEPLDNLIPPTLPSKKLIEQALAYNGTNADPFKAHEIVFQKIFDEPLHVYVVTGGYTMGINDACDTEFVSFNYGKYLDEISDDPQVPVNLNCADTSLLGASLLRSIGVPSHIWGMNDNPWPIPDYTTQVIHAFGTKDENGKDLWQAWDFEWHQLNVFMLTTYYYDAVMQYKEANKAKYATKMTWSGYLSNVFKLDPMIPTPVVTCAPGNAGIERINYMTTN